MPYAPASLITRTTSDPPPVISCPAALAGAGHDQPGSQHAAGPGLIGGLSRLQ
jgi:hypothetical protein